MDTKRYIQEKIRDRRERTIRGHKARLLTRYTQQTNYKLMDTPDFDDYLEHQIDTAPRDFWIGLTDWLQVYDFRFCEPEDHDYVLSYFIE